MSAEECVWMPPSRLPRCLLFNTAWLNVHRRTCEHVYQHQTKRIPDDHHPTADGVAMCSETLVAKPISLCHLQPLVLKSTFFCVFCLFTWTVYFFVSVCLFLNYFVLLCKATLISVFIGAFCVSGPLWGGVGRKQASERAREFARWIKRKGRLHTDLSFPSWLLLWLVWWRRFNVYISGRKWV